MSDSLEIVLGGEVVIPVEDGEVVFCFPILVAFSFLAMASFLSRFDAEFGLMAAMTISNVLRGMAAQGRGR